MATQAIRVMLVDDHDVLREGVASLLVDEPDMTIVGEAATGRQAVAKVARLRPDIVIMDIGMPELNGIDATLQIVRERPKSRVICLSVHQEKQMVHAMLRAGAKGYLLKTNARKELVEAVRTVAWGQTYLSPPVASHVVACALQGHETNNSCPFEVLSEREREVLQLIAEGLRTELIGAQLHISPRTVLAHRENIMKKLHLDSVVALARYAIREGIAQL